MLSNSHHPCTVETEPQSHGFTVSQRGRVRIDRCNEVVRPHKTGDSGVWSVLLR